MGYRYPTSRCRSLPELEDRVRELLRQLEPVILENRVVETTETAVAHGLGEVPGWVGWDPPHCVSIVRQTRQPDNRNVYLKATVRCVINLRVLRAGPLLPGQMPNGGYHLTDWDPGGADNDHLVKSSLTDATTVGGLVEKTEAGSNITLAEVTTGGVNKLRISATVPAADDHLVKSSTTDDTAVGGLVEKTDAGTNITLSEVTVSGVKKLRIAAGAADDHLVKAQNSDATTVGGLAEKTIASGGTELSVITDGGIEKLQIYCPESSVVTTPAAITWTPCYSVNFASQPDATLSDGPVTIDGKAWFVANDANAALMAVNPDGTGLKIVATDAFMHDTTGQQDSPSIGITLAELMGLLNLDLKVERIRIWVQADWVEAMSVNGEHFSIVVGYSQFNSGDLQKFSWRIRQSSGVGESSTFYQHQQFVSITNSGGDTKRTWQSGSNPPSTHYDVFMFEWWPNLYAVNAYYGEYTTRWPTIDEMNWCGRTLHGYNEFTARNTGAVYEDATYPFFAVTASPELSEGTHANVLLKKLKVEYQTTMPTSEGRPLRSTATVTDGILTIPSRSRTGTLFLSGDVTLDGVDIGGSGFFDGDEFELILSGSGSVIFNHNTGGLGTGESPFAVPAPSGESGIAVTVGGAVPVRNVMFRYLATEGFVLLSGGMLA